MVTLVILIAMDSSAQDHIYCRCYAHSQDTGTEMTQSFQLRTGPGMDEKSFILQNQRNLHFILTFEYIHATSCQLGGRRTGWGCLIIMALLSLCSN